MSQSTVTLNYLRFNTLLIGTPGEKSIYAHIYHVDSKKIENTTSAYLINWVKKYKNKYTDYITDTITTDGYAEWDNINIPISKIKNTSSLIIFILQKNKNMIDSVVDYYYLDINTSFLQNTQKVYNTDNYYLLEINNYLELMKNTTIKFNKLRITTEYNEKYKETLEGLINDLDTSETNNSSYIYNKFTKIKKNIYQRVINDSRLINRIEQRTIEKIYITMKQLFYKKYLNTTLYSFDDPLLIQNIDNLNMTTSCATPSSNFTIHYLIK